MATARKGGKVQSKIQMLLYGEQGCGKSTIASQFLYLKRPDGKPFRVLYLDNESGSIDDMLESIENDNINLDNLYIVYTQSLKEVNQYIEKATKKEPFYELDEEGKEVFDKMILDADGEQFIPDAIVVDGTSILNLAVKQGTIEFSKKRANVKAERDKLLGEEKFVKVEGAGIELKDYNAINFKGQDLVLTLTGSGLHYIVTARETDEKISVKDSEGKITSVATGKKIPEGFKGMGYNVKTEMRLFREEDDTELVKAFIVKDRTKTYKNGETVEDPSLFAFQSVIDKTKENKEVVVQNRLHDAIKKELKETEKEVLGEESQDDNDVNINIEELRTTILNRMSELGKTPKSKQDTKMKLEAASLPTSPNGFKAIQDINILQKAIEVLA
jgi:GTPase SAR1 family protein